MGNQGQAERRGPADLRDDLVGGDRHGARGPRRVEPLSRRSRRAASARPKETPPVPATLELGPVARPGAGAALPSAATIRSRWRGWWDFGTGVLGDIGCHQFSAVFKALKLGHPDWVEACSSNHQCAPEIANETAPLSSITRWHFPAKADARGRDAHLVGRRPEAAAARGTRSGPQVRRRRLADDRRRQGQDATATGSSPTRKAQGDRQAAAGAAALARPLRRVDPAPARAGRRPARTSSTTPPIWPRSCCWATSPSAPRRSCSGTARTCGSPTPTRPTR